MLELCRPKRLVKGCYKTPDVCRCQTHMAVWSAYRTSDFFAEPRSHGIDRIQGNLASSRSHPQAALLLLLVLVSVQRALAALFFEGIGTLWSCGQKRRAVCMQKLAKEYSV